jgi:hypothetical protein
MVPIKGCTPTRIPEYVGSFTALLAKPASSCGFTKNPLVLPAPVAFGFTTSAKFLLYLPKPGANPGGKLVAITGCIPLAPMFHIPGSFGCAAMLTRVFCAKSLGPIKGNPTEVAPNAAIPGADGGLVTFTTGSPFINII